MWHSRSLYIWQHGCDLQKVSASISVIKVFIFMVFKCSESYIWHPQIYIFHITCLCISWRSLLYCSNPHPLPKWQEHGLISPCDGRRPTRSRLCCFFFFRQCLISPMWQESKKKGIAKKYKSSSHIARYKSGNIQGSPSHPYIQKAGVAGVQTPQTILNFPQRNCLRTQKLSVSVPDS